MLNHGSASLIQHGSRTVALPWRLLVALAGVVSLVAGCGDTPKAARQVDERQQVGSAATTVPPGDAASLSQSAALEFGDGAEVALAPAVVASGSIDSGGGDWQVVRYRIRTAERTIECLDLRMGMVAGGGCSDVAGGHSLGLAVSSAAGGVVAHGRAPSDAVDVRVETTNGRRVISRTVAIAGSDAVRYYVIRLRPRETAKRVVGLTADGEIVDTVDVPTRPSQ